MKKLFLAMAVVIAAFSCQVYALDLKGLLGTVGTAATGVVEGIFTQTDITVEQMAGTWTATGSAVSFESDNFLEKAGGNATAKTMEKQLDNYYQKYGLTGSTMTINADGTFVWKIKGISLKGKITKRSDGNFDFAFTPFGSFSLGSIKAYVQKPANGLDIMFDASKLKKIFSTVLGLFGNSLTSSVGSLFDKYEGMYMGFHMSGTGSSIGTTTNGSPTINGETIKNAAEGLKNLFGK